MPLYKRKNIDWYRHLAFACVGGFFGAYAIMCRGGVMGSAQTVNLLELVIDALYGRGFNVLEHLGAFLLYAAATMLTVLLPFWWSVNVRRLSPIITAAAAMAECFIPAETEIVIALYPIFFAMAFQWSSFRGARNFYSSTIFSTNNTKQASLGAGGVSVYEEQGAAGADGLLPVHAAVLPYRRGSGGRRVPPLGCSRRAVCAAADWLGVLSGNAGGKGRGHPDHRNGIRGISK